MKSQVIFKRLQTTSTEHAWGSREALADAFFFYDGLNREHCASVTGNQVEQSVIDNSIMIAQPPPGAYKIVQPGNWFIRSGRHVTVVTNIELARNWELVDQLTGDIYTVDGKIVAVS